MTHTMTRRDVAEAQVGPAALLHAPLGVTPRGADSCTVLVWAPRAGEVHLEVGTGASVERYPLPQLENGYHGALVDAMLPGTRYAFRLDGGEPRPDPASRSQPDGVHAASCVVDLRDFRWTDEHWRGLPMRDYVIYELHVGTFTPEGTFDAAAARLDELAQLGITAVELMPVAEFPGARGWGYDGVNLFAPHSAYGGPDGLRRFVDAAHEHGIAVVLDVVYNHLGPEGNYLAEFGPYFSSRHHTPWGDGVNVDDHDSDEVRRFFCENALMWITDFHIDALRLDAVHGIIDTSAYPFLAELADLVAERAEELNRRVHLISESDLADVRVITPRAAGGWGHDAQWADDFHHALHVLVTGEQNGYYADFPNGLEDLAEAYRHGFVYRGQRSEYRRRRVGSQTHGRRPEQFVVCTQNHDQVGNRPRGDRVMAAYGLETSKLAAAALLLSPFTPMLFMGEEYGETNPFPYFVSHTDPQLLEAVRRGRRAEHASFYGRGVRIPDPGSVETFESAVLDWDRRFEGDHGALLRWHRALLHVRREYPALRPRQLGAPEVHVEADHDLLLLHWSHHEQEYAAFLNFGTEAVALEGMDADVEVLLDSEDERFGGHGTAGTVEELAPRGVLLMRAFAEH